MKGAVDGGLAIPHKPNRFPGFNKEKGELNAKARIFGAHVAAYVADIAEEKKSNPDEKITQFDAFARNKIAAGDLEKMYKSAHAAIRADPTKSTPKKSGKQGAKSKAFNIKKLTRKERQDAAPRRSPPS